MYRTIALTALVLCQMTAAMDNDLVRTPPMGWLSWERFACNIDCNDYPHECINEQLYKDMADRLSADGYKDVGYQFVNVDDCWSEKTRDPTTKRLVADRKRFPSGIKALADYVHSKGLLFGIYGDVGTKTCGGYPGARGADGTDYDKIDAQTYAEWGVDSLKLDGCYADTDNYTNSYPAYSTALNSTGRPIVYACSWPAYQIGLNPDYKRIKEYCNYWRNFDDIEDSWASVQTIIQFYGQNQDTFVKYHGMRAVCHQLRSITGSPIVAFDRANNTSLYADFISNAMITIGEDNILSNGNHSDYHWRGYYPRGPGAWNDPDMLIIGNYGLSYEQSKSQMALWALWSAPLLMSNDLRHIGTEYKQILQNKDIIGVNQDSLGILGRVVYNNSGITAWVKPMTPIVEGVNTYAVVYLNQKTLGTPVIVSLGLSALIPGLNPKPVYYVHDLFDNSKVIAKLSSHQNLTLKVNTSGSVRMVRLSPIFGQQSSNYN